MPGPTIQWKSVDNDALLSEIREEGRYRLASPTTVTGAPSLAMQAAGQNCTVKVYIGGVYRSDALLTVAGTTPVAILNAVGQPLTGQEMFDMVIEVGNLGFGSVLLTTDEPNGSPSNPYPTRAALEAIALPPAIGDTAWYLDPTSPIGRLQSRWEGAAWSDGYVPGGVGDGLHLPIEMGSDGDMVYTHSTGQKLFNGNFLYSWTYQGGGDYSNLTVDSTAETTIVDETDAGRNGLFPILSPGYLLGKGPIWVRVRGGYGVIGANPVLTVRVYMGATIVGTKNIDLSAFTRTTENMGFGLLFWIEPINALSPGTSLRLRTHHYGHVSKGLADSAGSFLLSEDETYSNIDGTAAQNIKVTAQWSALGSQTWAFFDGIEVYR